MRVGQIRLLRKFLAGLIILVLAAVAYNYLQTIRLRARIVRQTARILGTEMIRSADSIEYSEQENGIVRFKIRAEKLLETRQGQSLLEGIEASDRNPDGTTRNHIRSRRGTYDREGKKAHFFDDVRIDLSQGVQIRTDSLHYDFQSRSGETEDKIELIAQQGGGTARGVIYHQDRRELTLKSDVDFTLQRNVHTKEGKLLPERMRGRSERGYYSESGHMIRWQGNAHLDSDSASLSGDDISATFSEDKKKITSLLCSGNALYQSKDPGGGRILQGDAMTFGINPDSGSLERIDVVGKAAFSCAADDTKQVLGGASIHLVLEPLSGLPSFLSAQGQVQFRAARDGAESLVQGENLEAGFFAGRNLLEKVRVWGGARMTTANSRNSSKEDLRAKEIRMSFLDLQARSTLRELDADGSVKWISAPRQRTQQKRGEPGRTLSASKLQLFYAESGEYLESGIAAGNVMLEGSTAGDASGVEMRRMKADGIRFRFYPGENRLESFDGAGQVEIYYLRPSDRTSEIGGQEFRTSSDNMRATFLQANGEVQTILQWGNFVFLDDSRTATAGRSEYSAEKDLLTLRESPKITDSNAATTGDVISYDRKQKILVAQGHARSVLKPRNGGETTPFNSSSGASAPSVVTAGNMQYWTDSSRVRYSENVQMLSESGQLQARTLEISEAGDRVDAQGEVRHLLPKSEALPGALKKGQTTPPPGATQKAMAAKQSPILIRSNGLKYLKEDNSINYSGGVILQSDDLWMSADTITALFESEGRRIERAFARGKVHIRQAGREVKGLTGDYFLTPGKFVVTGELAEIIDPVKGRSLARRLTFYTTDDRLLLEIR